MRRFLLPLLLLAVLASTSLSTPPVGAATPKFRPDAWLKLCGQSNGCVIDPMPHPWVGNNVYNTTGMHQKWKERIDNGEGVRFWITIQNDGSQKDTFLVHGCSGNKEFYLNQVLVGFWKDVKGPYEATHITDGFKNGTAKFTLRPGRKAGITVNIITKDPGLTYRCPVTITSQHDPTKQDTVLPIMVSF
jgi:hypothetical protein